MDLQTDLVNRATAYCDARGFSLARLATLVVNDGKFFERLAGGGGCTLRTYERFIQYIADHPVHHPSDLPRVAAAID